ncbi:hypothetical protein [Shouchella clausii]|uniref:hypothetical protein n=1 Tax=Shouchella clausii TaxID=79880 RepID=UPI000BA4F31B|nr:hypothetical protein [Shouchella clausii]MCM3549179.1 hypothetical protein [Shouchella clausii]MEB5479467.1 hypothetical protein [Shouchella clausii]PAD12627.1 hypothetical protein CHH74_14755 [Shouchella clausii]PAD92569.1 hypothetical protein CHH52_09305 [Shouchella clausii]
MVGAVIYWHLHFHLTGMVNRLLSMAEDGRVATADVSTAHSVFGRKGKRCKLVNACRSTINAHQIKNKAYRFDKNSVGFGTWEKLLGAKLFVLEYERKSCA